MNEKISAKAIVLKDTVSDCYLTGLNKKSTVKPVNSWASNQLTSDQKERQLTMLNE